MKYSQQSKMYIRFVVMIYSICLFHEQLIYSFLFIDVSLFSLHIFYTLLFLESEKFTSIFYIKKKTCCNVSYIELSNFIMYNCIFLLLILHLNKIDVVYLYCIKYESISILHKPLAHAKTI